MKKILLYPLKLNTATRMILYIGSITGILFLLSGYIIYQTAPDFNHFLQAFRMGSDLMAAGQGFVWCTLFSAVLCEVAMRRVIKNEK